MKEFNLVKPDLQEDSYDGDHQAKNISIHKRNTKRKESKTSEKRETERWLNEVLDKRREWNKMHLRLANSACGFQMTKPEELIYKNHTG